MALSVRKLLEEKQGTQLRVNNTPAPARTISLPKQTNTLRPTPASTSRVKGFTLGEEKNKTIFGKNAAFLLPKQFEKTRSLTVNKDVDIDESKFVSQYDGLSDEFRKSYTNQTLKLAEEGDETAIKTVDILKKAGKFKGDVGDFIEGSNERLLGGVGRGLLRGADFVLPGKNTFGLERLADQQDPETTNTRQFTAAGKAGETAGTVQKGLVDAAALVLPAAKVEQAIRGTKLIQHAAKGGKLSKVAAYTASNVGGGIPATGVEILQNAGRGDETNLAESAGIGAAADLVTPALFSVLGKNVPKLVTHALSKNADEVAERAIKVSSPPSANPLDEKLAVKSVEQTEPAFKEFVQSKEVLPPVNDGEKLSRFANKTAQESDEISEPLKKLVKDERVTYTATTNAERQAVADDFLKTRSADDAFTEVSDQLDNVPKNSNGQEAINAITLIKKLDEAGDENSLFKATELFNKISATGSKEGQRIQALSALSARTPQGLFYQAMKTLRKAGVITDNKIVAELKTPGKAGVTPDGKIINKLKTPGETKIIPDNKIINKLKTPGKAGVTPDNKIVAELKTLVDAVKQAQPGSEADGLARFKVMDFVAKKSPSNVADKAVQLWKAGLLSGPRTTAGNLAANTAEQIYKRLYKDPLATAADVLFSGATGKRTKSLTFKGVGSGGLEGLEKGVKYFKTGYDPRNPLQKFDVKSVHFSDKPLGKAAEAYTQTVFKLMGAQDQPFYYASLRNSLYDQAITEAKNLKIKGAKRAQFIKKFVTEPEDQYMKLADEEARYDVFQNRTALGDVASKVNKTALGQFVIPFSQVPSSVATRMIDRTPLGFAKELLKQFGNPVVGKAGSGFDQRRLVNALSDASAGVAIIGAGSALHKAGMLTLGYPTDQKERDLWELEGKQSNSVKVGNTWVSMNYFQPLGNLLAAGGNYDSAVQNGDDPAGAWSSAAAGATKSLTDQSFLKGVSGAISAVSDPQRSAERFAENTAGSIVPNVIRSAARSIDPVNRERDGLIDSIEAGIPGLRQNLPERTDIFGDAVPRSTNAAGSYLNPFKPSDERSSTPLNQELRRLYESQEGTTAPSIKKDSLGADAPEMNAAQQRQLQNDIGSALQSTWDGIIGDDRYAQLDDIEKRKRLDDAKDAVSEALKSRYRETEFGLDEGKISKDARGYLLGTVDWLAKSGDVDINQDVSAGSRDILVQHGALDSDGRDRFFQSSNDAEYKYMQAKYENDVANGDLSRAQKVTREAALRKSEAGSQFSHETRELYGMSEENFRNLVANAEDAESIIEQVSAYANALADAGLDSKKWARFFSGSGSSSGGSSSSSSKSKLSTNGIDYRLFGFGANPVSTTQSLRSILKQAQVKA